MNTPNPEFVSLVKDLLLKIEEIENSKEYATVFDAAARIGFIYNGPTWVFETQALKTYLDKHKL